MGNKSCYDYYLLGVSDYSDIEIGKKRKIILDKTRQEGKKHIKDFYPLGKDLQNLPQNSMLIKITFRLKKPYTSKGEEEFYLLEWEEKGKSQQKIIENPIVRDRVLGCPMVRPSTWKGHLRFAAGKVEEIDGKKLDEYSRNKVIRRLFGSESEDENALKGRLYFFPTFFEEEAEREVITPLKRNTRTPAKGPINLEVIKAGKKAKFYLLYLPYPEGKDFKEGQIKEDLKFLVNALELLFLTYGFSAKKTSGFGIIEPKFPEEGQFEMTGIPKDILPRKGKFINFEELKTIIDKLCTYLEADNGR